MQTDAIEPHFFGLDDRIFMAVIAEGDTDQRMALASQLADFVASPETPEKEREQSVPALLKLAADPVFRVREVLAQKLVNVPDLNADLLFAIIADDDEIALPFLAETPALGHWHMLAVLRVGDDARRATVALRPDISSEAVGYIIESLPMAVNALMLENETLTLTADQYRALYDRFGETREVLDNLLARADLPLDIRIGHARLAASRMQHLVVERGWLPANGAVEMVTEAEEVAVLGILTSTAPEQRSDLIDRLVDDELLTPSLIVRAACTGAMDLVSDIVASLAGVSGKRAREAMFVKPAGTFKSLHGKAGLPQSCYWTLQAACDVAREERQEGVRLPPEDFGRRMIEVLLTRYEALPMAERPKQLDFVGRFAADRTRHIARRLKADLLRAA